MGRGVECLSYRLGTYYRQLISITSCFISIGKGRVEGREREGMGDDFYVLETAISWSMGIGQPP
jgi:hypothetical protein